MDYKAAHERATLLERALAPWCERIEIAGSIRRRKAIVKDIELVCIPHQEAGGLFADEPRHCEGFGDTVRRLGVVTAGSLMTGKHIKLTIPNGPNESVKVDLYTTVAINYGWRLLLSTGSREHNIRMVQRLKSNGYTCDEGHVLWKGAPLELPEERTVFQRAGLMWIEPQMRV